MSKDCTCEWARRGPQLEERLARLEADLRTLKDENSQLKKHVIGPQSERRRSGKMPDAAPPTPADPAATRARRKHNADQKKATLATRRVDHALREDQKVCPICGRRGMHPLGHKVTTRTEYDPGQFVLEQNVLETAICVCGQGIVTAEGPPNVVEQGKYGPGFIAHVVLTKIADAIPLCRLEKIFKRLGIHMSRSTMTDLLHAAARTLAPLYALLMAGVKVASLVSADETSIKVLARQKCSTAFLWVFLTASAIVYRFSPSRAGDTPQSVLGDGPGDKDLLTDGYAGYDEAVKVKGYRRIHCNSHARRYFFDALVDETAAHEPLDFYKEIYTVEAQARADGVQGTAAHLQLRQSRSKPAMDTFHRWLLHNRTLYPPRTSRLGKAIRYTLNHWQGLTRFLDDPTIPVDNNAAERALRIIALFRKNSLFLGNNQSGHNHAVLLTLIATCILHDVNPYHYLRDVLVRVQSHPAARLHELLPQNWKPALTEPDTTALAA